MKLRSSRFSPRSLDPLVLEQLTVGREKLLGQLVTNLTDTIASGQGRFDLLVGPRGIGKSHTLGLVEARIRASEALRERVVVVSLPEEFHPSSLVHLLARVLEGLPADDALPPVHAQLKLLRGKPAQEAESLAAAMIRGRLRERSLLLMLENLDALFRGLGREAQARLRKILQTERTWSIFATARSAIAMTKQSEPFHGTFVIKQLEPLSPTHGREMMVKLAQRHEQPKLEAWLKTEAGLARVRGVHHLVGGSPRVMAMIFHHLDPERLDDFEANFCGLAEELTPYFQEQIARLSGGQRPVMEFLAERWSPVSVQEIADGTFNEHGSISTHLRALRRDRLVQSIAVGKERFYEIAEPLHRIARAMKRDASLGAAIASIARVWALMDQADAQSDLGELWWDVGEPGTEFEARAIERLREAMNGRDGEEVERMLDMLLSHPISVHGKTVALFACLKQGRDHDAAPLAAALHRAGRHEALATAYFSAHGSCPVTDELLRSSFIEHIDMLDRVLGRIAHAGADKWAAYWWTAILHILVTRHDILFAAEFCAIKYPHHMTPFAWSVLVLILWLRRGLPTFAAALGSVADLSSIFIHPFEQPMTNSSEPDDDRSFQSLLLSCLVLDTLTAQSSNDGGEAESPAGLNPTLMTLAIALWIASGRDVHVLHEALQPHADRLRIPADVMTALAAEDNARAFVRLGAELRESTRKLLRFFFANEALASLPGEPPHA